MNNAHNTKLRSCLQCFLLLTVIFTVLYHPFLFGGQMYAYEDIGSDTIHQYLPNYTVELDLLRQGNPEGYNLQFGLGRYVSGLLTKYLNPSQLMLLAFGSNNLHIGLIAATYVKYVLICFFALLYFLRILKNEKAAVVSALLWTFSGYNVLWGQHYQFLTCMVGFTASMYGFQLYLEEDKKWYLAVPLLALLVGYSYYHTYIAAFFMVVYGILYLVFQQKRFTIILKKIGAFALLAVLTACICSSYLATAAIDFFRSTRTGQVESAASVSSLAYPAATLMTFLARFLSNNTIGIANAFHGTTNYYEAAMLSVGFLFTFSFAFLLQGKYRWRTLGISLVCIALLCTPLTSQLLVFTADTQRWTYLLCFLQTIAIGFALTEFWGHAEQADIKKRAGIAVLIGDGLLGLIGIALIAYHYHVGGGWLDKSSCLMIAAILCLYHLAFLLLWKSSRKFHVLLALVAVELVLGNYATVNHRDTITVAQWYTQMYNDGTQKVVQWIQEQDDSIYRVNKTYYSVYKTDSMVQGYNGMGSYSSTNSRHLVQLAKNWGYHDAGSWIGFDGTDWLANDMLGVKYIISRSGESQDPDTMELIYDDGAFCVYRNLDWSGFGYLCFEKMAQSSLSGLTRGQQGLLLTHYYYETGNNDAPVVEIDGKEGLDLLPYLTGGYDCRIRQENDGIEITDTGVDSQLYFTVPATDGEKVLGLAVEMTAENPSVIQLFAATEDAGYAAERSSATGYDSGRVRLMLEIPVDQAVSLRLDPTMAEGQTIVLHSVKLQLMDSAQLKQQQTLQRENAVTDLTQTGDTFTGTIVNPTDAEAMLCIPLIYSEDWKASLDGERVAVINVNGGLTGLKIPAGEHTFTLSYDDTVYTVGKAVSWCAIALYCLLAVWWHKKSK